MCLSENNRTGEKNFFENINTALISNKLIFLKHSTQNFCHHSLDSRRFVRKQFSIFSRYLIELNQNDSRIAEFCNKFIHAKGFR